MYGFEMWIFLTNIKYGFEEDYKEKSARSEIH